MIHLCNWTSTIFKTDWNIFLVGLFILMISLGSSSLILILILESFVVMVWFLFEFLVFDFVVQLINSMLNFVNFLDDGIKSIKLLIKHWFNIPFNSLLIDIQLALGVWFNVLDDTYTLFILLFWFWIVSTQDASQIELLEFFAEYLFAACLSQKYFWFIKVSLGLCFDETQVVNLIYNCNQEVHQKYEHKELLCHPK